MKTYKHQRMCCTAKNFPKSWVTALNVTFKSHTKAVPLEQTRSATISSCSPDTEEPEVLPAVLPCTSFCPFPSG